MLKGSQKQMIVVRTRDSRLFEEAYFVMRRGAGQKETDELDMLWEANRIIESSLPADGTRGKPSRGVADGRSRELRRGAGSYREGMGLIAGLVWFGMGLLTGGGLTGLILWLI